MKAIYSWLVGVIALLALVAFLFWPTEQTTTPLQNNLAATKGDEQSLPVSEKNLPDNIQAEVDYAAFQDQTRQFFESEKSLSAADKKRKAEQIDHNANHYQQQGFITASEALMLKLALLKLTLSDGEFEQQGKLLVEQYKKDYDVAYEQWRNTPDPKFSAYKQQEAEIVKRVMAMSAFPDGLSRDEYLRRELEKARIAIYQQP